MMSALAPCLACMTTGAGWLREFSARNATLQAQGAGLLAILLGLLWLSSMQQDTFCTGH
jgi:hypothetical protein